jgi:hypothetical protein
LSHAQGFLPAALKVLAAAAFFPKKKKEKLQATVGMLYVFSSDHNSPLLLTSFSLFHKTQKWCDVTAKLNLVL